MAERLFKERARRGVGVEQYLPLAGLLFRNPILGHLDAGLLAEAAEGVLEFDAVALDDEVDRVAAFLAAVAVEELPTRADRERRALFLVEGAQALVVLAGALERDGL